MSHARIALALALAACGAKGHRPETHQIDIKMMKFVPESVDVAVGDTVVWTNHDLVPHTATTPPGAAIAFDSKAIEPNATFSYTVTTAGDMPYVCTFHPTMKGMLLDPK